MLSFDDACIRFAAACVVASQWKHNYPGAAYSTRLYQAIGDLKAEIVLMEAVLEKRRGRKCGGDPQAYDRTYPLTPA